MMNESIHRCVHVCQTLSCQQQPRLSLWQILRLLKNPAVSFKFKRLSKVTSHQKLNQMARSQTGVQRKSNSISTKQSIQTQTALFALWSKRHGRTSLTMAHCLRCCQHVAGWRPLKEHLLTHTVCSQKEECGNTQQSPKWTTNLPIGQRAGASAMWADVLCS